MVYLRSHLRQKSCQKTNGSESPRDVSLSAGLGLFQVTLVGLRSSTRACRLRRLLDPAEYQLQLRCLIEDTEYGSRYQLRLRGLLQAKPQTTIFDIVNS